MEISNYWKNCEIKIYKFGKNNFITSLIIIKLYIIHSYIKTKTNQINLILFNLFHN